MNWYKKVLTEKRQEIIRSAIISVIIAFVFSLWYFVSGKSFEWQSINPIEAPGLLPRLFYSALVYITLGSFLYAVGFYKFLYSLYRGMRGGWKAYNDTKDFIWWVLILGMYFVIIPFVVDVLNAIISFFYNIAILFLYLSPIFGVLLISFAISYIIFIRYKPKND